MKIVKFLKYINYIFWVIFIVLIILFQVQKEFSNNFLERNDQNLKFHKNYIKKI